MFKQCFKSYNFNELLKWLTFLGSLSFLNLIHSKVVKSDVQVWKIDVFALHSNIINSFPAIDKILRNLQTTAPAIAKLLGSLRQDSSWMF